MSRIWIGSLTIVVLVALLAAISFLLADRGRQQAVGLEGEPYLIGIASEAVDLKRADTTTDVFVASKEGDGFVAQQLAPTYFPSLQRLGDGFVVPDKDSLVVLDASGTVVRRHEVEGLGVAAQAQASTSVAHTMTAFSFNEGTGELSNRHRIVTLSKAAQNEILTTQRPQFLTACDDGSARWLEYVPDGGVHDNLSSGTANMVTLNPAGELKSVKIDWQFSSSPGLASVLQCGSADSFLESDTEGREIIRVREDGSAVEDSGRLSEYALADGARFDYFEGDKYFALNSSGTFTSINMSDGTVSYEEFIDFDGKNPISVTFDTGKAFIVVQSETRFSEQGLIVVDLSDPSCVSDYVELSGFGETARNSHVVMDSIMAVDPDFKVECAEL